MYLIKANLDLCCSAVVNLMQLAGCYYAKTCTVTDFTYCKFRVARISVRSCDLY